MTQTRDAGHYLLQDILADPGDDGPRLIYADWLADNGEPLRAEFIRTQIRSNDRVVYELRGNAPRGERIKSGGHAFREDWLVRFLVNALHGFPFSGCELLFDRGFIAEVTAPLNRLLLYGPVICREHPVERLHVADKEPLHFDRGPGYAPWTFHVSDEYHGRMSPWHVPHRVWRRVRKTFWPTPEALLEEAGRVALELCREDAAEDPLAAGDGLTLNERRASAGLPPLPGGHTLARRGTRP